MSDNDMIRRGDVRELLQQCGLMGNHPNDPLTVMFNEIPASDVKGLVEALKGIDALDPESLVSGCSRDALSGLVNLMGAKARAALAAFEKEK